MKEEKIYVVKAQEKTFTELWKQNVNNILPDICTETILLPWQFNITYFIHMSLFSKMTPKVYMVQYNRLDGIYIRWSNINFEFIRGNYTTNKSFWCVSKFYFYF